MEINFIKYLTIKRSINILKIISSFFISRIIKKPVVWGMPISYSIEPTNYCNLKCPECPSGIGALTRDLGFLNPEKFRKIVDEISDTGFYLQLYFQGEPYLNKDLPQMISYARIKNVYTSVSTNGHYINEKNIDKILENSPDKLIFSMDGIDEETYHNYRVGGSFKKVDTGLKLLIEKRNKKKTKIPFVELQFIVMKQNEHLIDKVKNYAHETGVDKVTFKTMQVSSIENALKFLPSNNEFRRYDIYNDEIKIKSKLKNHCFALWRTSVITWDGKLVPCCFDKDAKYELGILNGKRVKDIWYSESYNDFRKKILTGRRNVDICSNCTEGLKVNIAQIEN